MLFHAVLCCGMLYVFPCIQRQNLGNWGAVLIDQFLFVSLDRASNRGSWPWNLKLVTSNFNSKLSLRWSLSHGAKFMLPQIYQIDHPYFSNPNRKPCVREKDSYAVLLFRRLTASLTSISFPNIVFDSRLSRNHQKGPEFIFRKCAFHEVVSYCLHHQ